MECVCVCERERERETDREREREQTGRIEGVAHGVERAQVSALRWFVVPAPIVFDEDHTPFFVPGRTHTRDEGGVRKSTEHARGEKERSGAEKEAAWRRTEQRPASHGRMSQGTSGTSGCRVQCRCPGRCPSSAGPGRSRAYPQETSQGRARCSPQHRAALAASSRRCSRCRTQRPASQTTGEHRRPPAAAFR